MSANASNTSRSPSRGMRQSFSEQISDMKTKLVRALSSERQSPGNDGSQYSRFGEDIKSVDRSLSRGREPVVSFGRGGLGNMRPSSTSREPDNRDISLERGRGANRLQPTDGIDGVPEDPRPRSTGRGGLANITDLKTPDIEPPVHVVHPEHERVSTGRGGVGNIRDRSQSKVRDQPEPHVRLPHQEGELVFSSGRGGAGNIRSRSQSKPPGEEKAHDHKSGTGNLFQKVIHPHS